MAEESNAEPTESQLRLSALSLAIETLGQIKDFIDTDEAVPLAQSFYDFLRGNDVAKAVDKQ